MIKNIKISLLFLFFLSKLNAQNVGINTTTPHVSAALDVESTTKGVLVPRMTLAQRDAILTPSVGLLIFQTDGTSGFYFHNGTGWKPLSDGASQLEKIGENGNTGYRLLGRDAAVHGDIGVDAVDLSAGTVGTNKGATGNYSFASGVNTIASGNQSVAMGESTTASGSNATAMGNFTMASAAYSQAMGFASIASGEHAVAMGNFTTASGKASTATGQGTIAKSFAEMVVGSFNTDYAPRSTTTRNPADRAFSVGIGSDFDKLQDALITFKNGNTFISNNGGTPASGTTTILSGINAAALQVRASGDGINILSSAVNHNITVAKSTAPSNGHRYISLGHTESLIYAEIGSISAASATTIAFNTSSDKRLKNDNGLFFNGLSTLKNIKIHNYTWRETNQKDIGVFAQELYEAYPNAVTKGDDNATEITKRWQVDYSKLVPVLVAATQEQQTQIEDLKKENADLKKKSSDLEKQNAAFAERLAAIEHLLKSQNLTAEAKK